MKQLFHIHSFYVENAFYENFVLLADDKEDAKKKMIAFYCNPNPTFTGIDTEVLGELHDILIKESGTPFILVSVFLIPESDKPIEIGFIEV